MRLIKNSIFASALTIALAGCVGMEKDTAAEMTPEGSAFTLVSLALARLNSD